MSKKSQNSESIGTSAYENWKRADEGNPSQVAIEFPLFTDAYITGEVTEGLGPYLLFNTVPGPLVTGIFPYIVLRLEHHLNNEWFESNNDFKTNTERYHGGLMQDEIAALLSLCLGIRLKAGGENRRFDLSNDPRGHPYAYDASHDPYILKASHSSPILTRALGQHNLIDATLLTTIPKLLPSEEIALMRAARLYQDAVWIAESEPALSWIMLVSAIEVAANYWRSAKETPIERLRSSKLQSLEILLERSGGSDLLIAVAEQLAPYLGATAKFRDFILEFLPEPPTERPPEYAQINWDKKNMRKFMELIYAHRSSALHGGTPFPAPMCQPPNAHKLAERPLGTATLMSSATWTIKDTPMLLQTFEYIVRNCLLKWWGTLATTRMMENDLPTNNMR